MSDDDDKKPSAEDILFGKGASGNDDKPLKGNADLVLKPDYGRRPGHVPKGLGAGPAGPTMNAPRPQHSREAADASRKLRTPEAQVEKQPDKVTLKTDVKEIDDQSIKDGFTPLPQDKLDERIEKERRKAELKERQKAERMQDKSQGRDDEGR